MLRLLTPVLLVLFTLMLSNCSSPKPLYYYGDYSEEYYHSKKELTPEARIALQHSIEEAIQNADEGSSGRVAPGMYANLGYLYLKAGQTKMAIANFKLEKSIYPESAKFMDRMIKKIEALERDEDEE